MQRIRIFIATALLFISGFAVLGRKAFASPRDVGGTIPPQACSTGGTSAGSSSVGTTGTGGVGSGGGSTGAGTGVGTGTGAGTGATDKVRRKPQIRR